MNMDTPVKPPQPGRILQALQPWIVKVYRIAGIAALGAILVGLILFLTSTMFWYFNRTWVRPVILSPEHTKVVAASNALHDAETRLSDSTLKLKSAQDEAKRIEPQLARDRQWLADFTATAKPTLADKDLADAKQSEVATLTDRETELADEIKDLDARHASEEKEVAHLAASPYIAAAKEQRVVGFVPYQNLSSAQPGTTLYACDWGLIKCHSIGKIVSALEGEVQEAHPHDDSVQRGVYVELELTDPDAAHNNVVFAGSKPFWWL